jgi:hypothetical protein
MCQVSSSLQVTQQHTVCPTEQQHHMQQGHLSAVWKSEVGPSLACSHKVLLPVEVPAFWPAQLPATFHLLTRVQSLPYRPLEAQ